MVWDIKNKKKKENQKEKHLVYVSKNTFKSYVDLLLMGEEDKTYYVLVRKFNKFTYGHILYRGR